MTLSNLDTIGSWYTASEGFRSGWSEIFDATTRYRYDVFRDLIKGKRVLELGFADGATTSLLLEECLSVEAVDGSSHLFNLCQNNFDAAIKSGKLILQCCLFENFVPTVECDVVLASGILEHVDDPVQLLKAIARFLNGQQKIIVVVPNADSLHRQAAVEMGLLTSTTSLNDQDRQLGHRRVYSPSGLTQDLVAAGYVIDQRRGVFLKPVSNRQLETTWSPAMLNAYANLGKKYPLLSSEICFVASRK